MKPFTHAEYEAFRMYDHDFESIRERYERAEFELDIALNGDPETQSDYNHIDYLRKTVRDYEHFLLMKAYRNAIN